MLIPSASLGRHSNIDGSDRIGGTTSARARIPGDAHRNVRAKKLAAAVRHGGRGLPAHSRMILKCFCGNVEHLILDIVAIRDGPAEQDGAGPRHPGDVGRDHASSAGLGGAYAHITLGRQAHEPLSGAYTSFCGHVEHVILDIVAIRDGPAEQDGAGPRHPGDVRRDHASSAGLGGAYAHITLGRQAHEPLSGAYTGGVQGRLINIIQAGTPPGETKQPLQACMEASALAGVDEKERYTRKMT